jgi:hypothetical protein
MIDLTRVAKEQAAGWTGKKEELMPCRNERRSGGHGGGVGGDKYRFWTIGMSDLMLPTSMTVAAAATGTETCDCFLNRVADGTSADLAAKGRQTRAFRLSQSRVLLWLLHGPPFFFPLLFGCRRIEVLFDQSRSGCLYCLFACFAVRCD